MITEYEVGQIPQQPLVVTVLDEFNNVPNLAGYTTYEIELLGSDNEGIDLTGVTLNTESARNGRFLVLWPKTHSLFTKRGDYLLRLVFKDDAGSRDYTRTHTIRVREFGRVN